MVGKAKERPRAGRYTGDDVDEHALEAGIMMMGPPCMVAVFKIPEEEALEEVINKAQEELHKFRGRLRALNLNVEQLTNKTNTLIFLKVSAPEAMLKYEAEENDFRLRLLPKYGGALCRFTQELEDKNAYDKPLDGFALFCSAQQLKIATLVACGTPYDDPAGELETDWGQPLDPRELIEDSESQMDAWFPLHHERNRMKLRFEWATPMFKPQPLLLVKEYFGEKYALFYTWWGFYTTMLWLPALVGLALFVSEMMTFMETGSLQNPYMVVYAIFMSIWISGFNSLWKQLEATRMYEWDTLEFENEEQLRQDFKQCDETEKMSHVNDVTGDLDDFYYDDGVFFPVPTNRARSKVITYVIVMVMNLLVVISNVYIWKFVALPMMEPGSVLVGTIVGSILSVVVSIVVDSIMDGIPELELDGIMDFMVADANWDTPTRHEDALIMNTFYYKMFTKYFMLFWIAFLANHIEVDGEDVFCPDWQCFPVLQVAYVVIVLLGIGWNLLQVKLLPVLYASLKPGQALDEAAAAAGISNQKTPFELQHEMPEAAAVVDGYMVLVYQLGYVGLFAIAFPLVPLICVVYNVVELRSKAMGLLTGLRRPEFQCAADIGSYQQVIEVIATLSIITNAFVVGFTSQALYFYFPEMDGVERVWATVILEHFLFICKLFVENIIPKEPVAAIDAYNQAEDTKHERLAYWGIDKAEDY